MRATTNRKPLEQPRLLDLYNKTIHCQTPDHRSRVSLSGALNKLFRVLLLTYRDSVGQYCDKSVSIRWLRDVLIHPGKR
jgi:hypothetical protein